MVLQKKIKKSLFVLSIILALYFTLEIIGKKFVFPFPAKLEFSNITSAHIVDNKKSLIVDKQGAELIFLNENKDVSNIVYLDDANNLSRISDITKDNNYFYVLGEKLFRNSVHIEYERVVRYTLDGEKPTIIYELKRDDKSYVKSIKDINVVGNSIFITKVENIDDSENAVTNVYKISLDDKDYKSVAVLSKKTPYVFDAKYLFNGDSLFTTDYFGRLSSIKNNTTEILDFSKNKISCPFLPLDTGACVWFDINSEKLYKNDEVISKDVIPIYISLCDNKLIYDNQNNQSINIYDLSKYENIEYTHADFSKEFFILTFLRFISAIYLIFLVLYLLVKSFINKYKEKDFAFLKKIGLIAIAVVATNFISIFYENKHVESTINLIKSNMKVMAGFFAETLDKESFYNIDLEKKEDLLDKYIIEKSKYNDYYGTWTKLSNDYNSFVYLVLYKKYNDKNVLLYDSTGRTPYNIVVKENSMSSQKATDTQIFSFAGAKTYFLVENIVNGEGEAIGTIEIGLDYNIFNKQAITECFEMSMSLLTIFVAIYLLIIEGLALVKGFRNRKNSQDKNTKYSEIHLMHSLIFFQSLVTSFDAIILVLISKDMIRVLNYPIEYENYLITLPSLALGIGSIVGPILYVFLAKRLDVRKCLITNGIIITLAYVVITYAVNINNFVVFCIAKFVVALSNIIVYTGISIIPYRSDIEEERYIATHEKSLGKVSASIFGTLVGGVAAQYLGNASIYTISTISCIPIVLLLFLVLPKNTYYLKSEKKIAAITVTKNYIQYIFSAPMISFIIFVLGPVMISGGYRTYVFPLFTQALNMPKMYITNFYVFARVIMMILSGPIIKATKKIDYWNLMIYCLIAIGLSFMTFGINTTVVWAIIMLAINSIIDKISLPTKAMLWPRQAEAMGLNVAETQTLMTLLEKVLFSFKEVAFAVLLVFGDSKACVIFGAISLISAFLFAILTKNSTMTKNVCAKK